MYLNAIILTPFTYKKTKIYFFNMCNKEYVKINSDKNKYYMFIDNNPEISTVLNKYAIKILEYEGFINIPNEIKGNIIIIYKDKSNIKNKIKDINYIYNTLGYLMQ